MVDTLAAPAPAPEKPHADEVPLLEAVGIAKLYGDFLANDAINLEIWPAEVHALLGENGAGKSTLVKMIYGLLQPSAGVFRWQGEPVVLAGPAAASGRQVHVLRRRIHLHVVNHDLVGRDADERGNLRVHPLDVDFHQQIVLQL